MNLSNMQVIKEIKAEARKVGLVFRQDLFSNLYVFHDYKTKSVQLNGYTLGSAYDAVASGYIASYNRVTKTFSTN